MFTSRSRDAKAATDTVKLPDGREVVVVRFPQRLKPDLLGYHRRLEGQRLDHIAAVYLKNPTGFWRLCDANETISPESLSARELIGVPVKER